MVASSHQNRFDEAALPLQRTRFCAYRNIIEFYTFLRAQNGLACCSKAKGAPNGTFLPCFAAAQREFAAQGGNICFANAQICRFCVANGGV